MDVSVTVPKNVLRDGAVTTPKIADNAVTTPKINNAAVTKAKLAALGQVVSSSIYWNYPGSSGWNDVTNATCTITTTGRPVVIMLIPCYNLAGGAGVSNWNIGTASAGNTNFRIMRDSTTIVDSAYFIPGSGSGFNSVPPSVVNTVDYTNTTPGTYVYKLRVDSPFGGSIRNFRLLVYEL